MGTKSSKKNGKNTSRDRRRMARAKADAGYSDQAHPRNSLNDTLDVAALRETVEPIVEQFRLVLEEVKARGAGRSQTVTVVVDLPEDQEGSVSLDTIAEVSEAVSEALDAAESVPENAYRLEVTSPGATRSLTEPRHWKRARGRLIAIRTEDGEQFSARLQDADDAAATISRRIETQKGVADRYADPERLPLDRVASAKVEIEFGG